MRVPGDEPPHTAWRLALDPAVQLEGGPRRPSEHAGLSLPILLVFPHDECKYLAQSRLYLSRDRCPFARTVTFLSAARRHSMANTRLPCFQASRRFLLLRLNLHSLRPCAEHPLPMTRLLMSDLASMRADRLRRWLVWRPQMNASTSVRSPGTSLFPAELSWTPPIPRWNTSGSIKGILSTNLKLFSAARHTPLGCRPSVSSSGGADVLPPTLFIVSARSTRRGCRGCSPDVAPSNGLGQTCPRRTQVSRVHCPNGAPLTYPSRPRHNETLDGSLRTKVRGD